MLNWTRENCKIGGNTNSSFIALIPKEVNPSNCSRFGPISLCNASYKILTKIIACKLNNFMPPLISKNQGGFLSNRNVYGSIILVQEAIHSIFLSKARGMFVKLDLANSFDIVRHSFMFQVLDRFGFGYEFINFNKAYISSPWIAPLANGRHAPSFQALRGLRKGSLLSPSSTF